MRASGERSGAVTAAVGVAMVVAMLSFAPVVQGALWWWRTLLLVVVVLAVSAAGRRAGLPAVAGALVAASSVLPVATLATFGLSSVVQLGARQSAEQLLLSAAEAFRQIEVDTVPAPDTPELALVMSVGAALIAIVVDLVAAGLGASIAGLLVVLAVAIVPGKVFATPTDGWVLLLVAAAGLLLIAADRRRRGAPPRLPGLLAGGAVAVVLTLAAQVVLPPPVASQAASGPIALFGTGVDPLVRLGENLRRGGSAAVLSYTTTGSDPVYLRLAVLEDFTGRVWSPNPADGRPLRDSDAPEAAGLTETAVRGSVRTSVVPADPDSVGERLPVPYPATAIEGAGAGDFRWEDRGLTLVRGSSSPVGPYAVVSARVDTSAVALRRAATDAPVGDSDAATLPGDVPSIIRTTAQAWTRDAATAYDKALAIQNHLAYGAFVYDEDTPAQRGYDGDGLGVIAEFLRVKAGYCIHYASTMAVMARLEDIPSRIVVGYQPGEAQPGTSSRLVKSDALHAWPELFFDGIGWVRFEPTPGRGSVPAYAPLPGASGSATPSADAASAAPVRSQDTGASSSNSGGRPADPGVIAVGALKVLGIAAGAGALLAVPAVVRVGLRRRRLRPERRGVRGAWRELIDSMTDLGLPTGQGRSPRAVEEVLARHIGPGGAARSALARIRAAYERQAYSPEPVPIGADDVRAVVHAAGERVSRTRRILATVAPRSLVATLARSRLAFGWSPPGSG